MFQLSVSKVSTTAVALVSATLGFGIAPYASANDVTVGFIGALTGGAAPIGTDMRKGAELAVEDFGTLNGRKIRLVVEDGQCSAQIGITKAQQLIQKDGAKVLIGGTCSSVALGIGAQMLRMRVPFVTTNAIAAQVTGKECNPYMFRTNANDQMIAAGTAELFKTNPELAQKRWFTVLADNVFGRSSAEQLKAIPGVKIVGEAARPLGTTDWSSIMPLIRQSGAEGVFIALVVGNDMPTFIKQARAFGLDQTMLPPGGMPDSMLDAIGDGAVGITTGANVGSWMLEDQNPRMKEFVQRFHKKYGAPPSDKAIQTHAGMTLVLTAMSRAKSLDGPDLISAIEAVSAESVLGQLSIRAGDHQGRAPVYQSQVVRLDPPKYGQRFGWKIAKAVPFDQVALPVEQTGCTMRK